MNSVFAMIIIAVVSSALTLMAVCVGAWMCKRAQSASQNVWPTPPKTDTDFLKQWANELQATDDEPKQEDQRIRA